MAGRSVNRRESFVRDLYGFRLVGPLIDYVLAELPRVVDADQVSWNHVWPRSATADVIAEPAQPRHAWFADALAAHCAEHPLLLHFDRTGDGSARKISDFMSRREYHDSGLYADFYRYLGYEDQFAIQLKPRGPRTTTVVVARDRASFSERDRRLLNDVRPHLVAAYRQATVVSELARRLDRRRRHAAESRIELNRTRVATLYPERARRWLEWYWRALPQAPGRVPEPVERWFFSRTGAASKDGNFATDDVLVARRGGRLLEIRRARAGGRSALSLRERPDPRLRRRCRVPGLTPRECEVLSHIERGMTNHDIAGALGCAPATVKKHLEHIYTKLGVDNRTAAVGRLRDEGRFE